MSGNFSCPNIDFVFLQDLSGSYSDDLPILKSQIANVIATVEGIDATAQFAVSSFIDKPNGTFGATSDYVYQTHLSMTGDNNAVIAAVNALSTRSGMDEPEAQLEGLMQAALRVGEVGYRADSMRIVMLSTDSSFHQAGDFAGKPANNGDTILDGNGLGEDYPSIAQTAAALVASGVFPVFSVTSAEAALYQTLVDQLGTGAVVILSSNSSDFADAVRAAIAHACGHLTDEGTEYDDTLTGTEKEDGIFGLGGDDDIRGAGGSDLVDGGSGRDKLFGGRGNDDVYGGTGDDTLSGNGGRDFISGGIGADRLRGGKGRDTFVINPGDGTDTIVDFQDGRDKIDLSGFHRYQALAALATATQAGADVVMTLFDGTTITIRDFTLAQLGRRDVIVNPVGDPPTAVDDVAAAVERVATKIDVLANDSDVDGDALTITAVAGSANADVAITKDGQISYRAHAGFTGTDSFSYTISDGRFTDTATVTVNVTPNLTGSGGNDLLTGTTGNDDINARGGNDTVNGLAGLDTIKGGAGNDLIDGGLDGDSILGGKGNDTITGGPGTTGDQPDRDTVDGGAGRDLIGGGWGDDSLSGGAGADTIRGDLGDDQIFGGSGNDSLDGGGDNDEIHGNSGNDRILGGDGNDQIWGEAGNDTIAGGAGVDQIYGSGATRAGLADDDRLSGGSGADIFIFQMSLDRNLTGNDTITDYDYTQDSMNLDGDVRVTLTDTAAGVLIEQSIVGGSILVEGVLAADIRATITGLHEIA